MTLRKALLCLYPLTRSSDNKSAVYSVEQSARRIEIDADEDVDRLVAEINLTTCRDTLGWSCKSTWVVSSSVQNTWRNPTKKEAEAIGDRSHWSIRKVIRKLAAFVKDNVCLVSAKST